MPSSPPFAVPAVPVFRAVAATIVPDAARLERTQWDELEAIVGRYVASRPPSIRRQLTALLILIDWLAVLRFGRRFRSLDDPRRTRFLAGFEDAPSALVRRGFWGLRTLILMGYYGRAQVAAAIGYRADARGWEARR
jgi:hypothetical protein